ncbi:hypothetical protein BH09MYX1_BH09MYX1_37260 [soil metagenome]
MRGRARAIFVFGLLFVVALTAAAEDNSHARNDLNDPDFRVRVAGALALGKSHDGGARAPLEVALGDSNVAVRSAAAAALGQIGDTASVPALQRAIAKETSESVKAQMTQSLDSMNKMLTLQGVQVVIQLGTMRNTSGVRGEQLADVLRNATTNRARSMPNAVVAGPQDAALLQRARDKQIPVMALDGTILRLSQTQSPTSMTVQAQVEFNMRKVPDQTLKGTLTGAATSVGTSQGPTSPLGVLRLQDQAVDGAVESALRGADQGIVVAAR